jgi:short-subunit dehydrogenase
MDAKNGYALVTGGTGGIGFELARLLAADGYGLILVARGEEGLARAARDLELGYRVTVLTFPKDLSVPQNVFDLVQEIKGRGLTVEVLVNDAGQGLYGEFKDTDLQRELSIVELNISATLILTKAFLTDMVARKSGRILNLSSIASKLPGPLQAVYHGTKAFVHSFTEAIRNELKDSGVTVTSLLPGPTDTDFFRKAGMQDARNVQSGDLADPARVARDGYDAMKANRDMVVSGLSNKMQVAMSNVLPDSTVAEMVHKQQAPGDKDKQKTKQ